VSVDLKRFKSFGFDTLVLDELSRLKHTGTVTFKSLKHVLPTFQRRWGLTGSPASNGLEGLFGQMYCLDLGRAFGQYITHYRNEFFLPHPSGFGWRIRPGAEKDIYARIAPTVLRLAASDYIDMPELIERRIMFDLPDDVRKIYDSVEDEMYAAIDAGIVVAANAASASSKCLQIASGGVYLEGDDDAPDTKRRWQNLHTIKVDLLADLVEEMQGQPVLVAYHFKHDLDRLLLRFGKNIPFVGGGTSPKRALEIEAAWNAGEIPLLLGHPMSIGHGLNLQGSGNTVVWHTPTWDLELAEQFVGRVHRQGQKAKHVFSHTIMARDTVEEAVWYAVHNKAKGQNALFDALQQTRRRK
jgi:SNF2 family DNA or RNA helicase